MKAKLFEGLTAQEIIDNLEAENCGVQDNFKYIQQYTNEETIEVQESLSTSMVEKSRLNQQIAELVQPLKEEVKELDRSIKECVVNLEQCGTIKYGKVYCFPDYEANLMGLYNDAGVLVDTRPLTRAERQLHINSYKQVSNG